VRPLAKPQTNLLCLSQHTNQYATTTGLWAASYIAISNT